MTLMPSQTPSMAPFFFFFFLLFLLLSLTFFSPVTADDGTSCSAMTQGLEPCLAFLNGRSSPTPSCCNPLQNVLSNSTQLNCLCAYLNDPQYTAMIQAALKLPQECGLSIVITQYNCSSSNINTTSTDADPSAVAASSSAYRILGFPFSAVIIMICAMVALFLL